MNQLLAGAKFMLANSRHFVEKKKSSASCALFSVKTLFFTVCESSHFRSILKTEKYRPTFSLDFQGIVLQAIFCRKLYFIIHNNMMSCAAFTKRRRKINRNTYNYEDKMRRGLPGTLENFISEWEKLTLGKVC